MTTRPRSTRRGAVLTLVCAVLLAGCAEDTSSTEPSPSPSAAVPSTAAVPAPPRVGTCHRLTLEQATQSVDAREPVRCSEPHTSVTVRTGRIDALADGHLLAVDSATVRRQIADACPPALAATVGGSVTAQRLSTLETVWFGPSLEQADAGADWYRCDVVALRGEGRLMTLPARIKGVLDQPGALERFGTCGTAAPGKPRFERVACSEPHAWRAVDVVDLPDDTRYLARSAGAAADASCKDIASSRAGDSLKYSWGFEWPTRTAWAEGQRHGLCWVPE